MKTQIRKGVFETNSSSTHSVSFYKTKGDSYVGADELPQTNHYIFFDDNDNYHESDDLVAVELGKYGWDIKTYTEVYDKLSYLLTMGIEIFARTYEERFPDEATKGLPKDFIVRYVDSEIFKAIEEVVIDYYKQVGLKCEGIYIQTEMEEGYGSYYVDAYIDHQSCEYYKTLDDYFNDWGVSSITEFIFDKDCAVHTDNDNHY